MFKRFFSFRNPLGLLVSCAAVLLSLSPKARNRTKRGLVRGLAGVFFLGDQMKHLSLGGAKKLRITGDKSNIENPSTGLPEFSDTLQYQEDSSIGMNQNDAHTLGNLTYDTRYTTELGEEFIQEAKEQGRKNNEFSSIESSKPDQNLKNLQQSVQNVLSEQAYIEMMKNPTQK